MSKSVDEIRNMKGFSVLNDIDIKSKHSDDLDSSRIRSSGVMSNNNTKSNDLCLSESVDQTTSSTDECSDIDNEYSSENNEYSTDTKFECARLNLFPDSDSDPSKRCANVFSQKEDLKRYANDFKDFDQLKRYANEFQSVNMSNYSKSCDNSRNCSSELCVDHKMECNQTEDSNQNITIKYNHVGEHEQDTSLNSAVCVNNNSSSMSVIPSPESLIRNDVSVESLNDYFDSLDNLGVDEDTCSVDIIVTDDRHNPLNIISSPSKDLEEKFTSCSIFNSSASSSSSSYYSFTSSPSSSMTFSSSTNEMSHDKT